MRPKTLVLGEISARVFSPGQWSRALAQTSLRHCSSVDEALVTLNAEEIACLLLADIGEPAELRGLVETIQRTNAAVPVIVVSSRISLAEAVRLVRAGVWNCFGSGDNPDDFRESVESVLDRGRRVGKNGKQESEKPSAETGELWRALLIGHSQAIETVAETIRLVGKGRCAVLISGEAGTGKGLAARAIHMASSRAQRSIVPVNCAVPPESLEAELFGPVPHASTGVLAHPVRCLERAHTSTIFLDEIGSMPIELQTKLLKVLQERRLERYGGSGEMSIDIRVVAATSVDLAERVRQGKFEEDLYYRLNIVPLKMPSLRDRVSDIPVLVAHFVRKICQRDGLPIKRVTAQALRHLAAGQWPGNVRQLESRIGMAIAASGESGTLYPKDFESLDNGVADVSPDTPAPEPSGVNGTEPQSDRLELAMMEKALRMSAGGL